MNFEEMLDNATAEQQQQANNGYQFATGGVGDYDSLFDEMSQPKQFFEQGEDVELPETPEQMAAKQSAAIRVNLKGAEFLVNNGDRLIAWLCTMFIDAEADVSATKEEKSEMANLWAMVLPADQQLPPWVMAALTMALIYGAHVAEAIKAKKMKAKLDNELKENDRLRKENEKLLRKIADAGTEQQ